MTIQSMLQQLRFLLWGGDEVAVAAASRPRRRSVRRRTGLAPAAARPMAGAQDGRRLINIVEDSISSGNPVVAGTVQVLGLDSLQRSMGAAWPAFAQKAREIAAHEIRKFVGEHDFVGDDGENHFVVCYSDLGKEAAEKQAREMVDTIKTRLDENLPDDCVTNVESFVGAIDPDDLDLSNGHDLIAQLIARLNRLEQQVHQEATKQRRVLFRDVDFSFLPMLNTESGIADFSRCSTDTIPNRRILERLRNIPSHVDFCRALGEANCLVLIRALEKLHGLNGRGKLPTLVVPVLLEALSVEESRKAYELILSRIPELYRRSIVIEINSMGTRGVLNDMLVAVRRLRQTGIRIAMQLPLFSPLLPFVGELGVEAVGCSFSCVDWKQHQVEERIGHFAGMVRASGVAAYAHNANTVGLAISAMQSKFDYVDGTALHLGSDTPKSPFPIRVASI